MSRKKLHNISNQTEMTKLHHLCDDISLPKCSYLNNKSLCARCMCIIKWINLVSKGECTAGFLMCLRIPIRPHGEDNVELMYSSAGVSVAAKWQTRDRQNEERKMGRKKKKARHFAITPMRFIPHSTVFSHPHTAVSLDQSKSKDLTSVSLHLYSNLKRQNEPCWTFIFLCLKVKSQQHPTAVNVNGKSKQWCRCFCARVWGRLAMRKTITQLTFHYFISCGRSLLISSAWKVH